MSRRGAWSWTEAGVVVDREIDGSLVQVWLNPELPPEGARSAAPMGVEMFCSFPSAATLDRGLRAFWEEFGRDSVLAGIRRRDDICRVLVYTSAREPAVERRYFAVRRVLRPTAMGLRLGEEPAWETLRELVAEIGPASEHAAVLLAPGAIR